MYFGFLNQPRLIKKNIIKFLQSVVSASNMLVAEWRQKQIDKHLFPIWIPADHYQRRQDSWTLCRKII